MGEKKTKVSHWEILGKLIGLKRTGVRLWKFTANMECFSLRKFKILSQTFSIVSSIGAVLLDFVFCH